MNDLESISVDVITPVYNRAHYLENLFFSIAQHRIIRNWIVVDDGSEDCPDVIISSFPKTESLNIIYKRIEKSGFNAALNIGFSFLESTFFLKVDSDDLICKDFTANLKNAVNQIMIYGKESHIYGFSFRTMDKDNNLLGTLNIPDRFRISHFPSSFICQYSYVRVYSKISSGDLADIFLTSFAKYHFRYPIFADENYSPTSLLHSSYALKYLSKSLVYVDAPLLIKNYLPDGLTQRKLTDLRANPKSYLLLALQQLSFPLLPIFSKIGLLKTIVRANIYILCSFIANLFK